MDGSDLRLSRHANRRRRSGHESSGQARCLHRGCRLRDEQRARLRLPARQHGVQQRRQDATRPRIRDRGRGRLDPDRRGPYAADHLGTDGRDLRAVPTHRPDHSQTRTPGRGRRAGRLLGRREGQAGPSHRGRARDRRSGARRGRNPSRRSESLRPHQHHPGAPPQRGTARARTVSPQRGVHRP